MLTQHVHRIYMNPAKQKAVMGHLGGEDAKKLKELLFLCNFICEEL